RDGRAPRRRRTRGGRGRRPRGARGSEGLSQQWGRDETQRARERLIWRVGDLLTERAAEFGQLEALDNGKSAAIASAVDTAWAADVFRYYAGWATKIEGHRQRVDAVRPGGEFHAYTLREPVGVCGLIVPWKFRC
ncbi:aldehyde dehydrogenase family protein, partial [Rhodococcus hoagii]|nr:aldehyde dehydrogenase family protein [Prescottella equi]